MPDSRMDRVALLLHARPFYGSEGFGRQLDTRQSATISALSLLDFSHNDAGATILFTSGELVRRQAESPLVASA